MNKLLIAGLTLAGIAANTWMASRLVRNDELRKIPELIAKHSSFIAMETDFDEAWKLLHFDRFLATAGMSIKAHRDEYERALGNAFRTEFNKRRNDAE